MTATPFLKWPGGKRTLADRVLDLLGPLQGRTYMEPFVGGGAVWFALQARDPSAQGFLSDVNPELIECYTTVRDDVEALIVELSKPHYRYDEERYYRIRAAMPLDRIARAARTIYLNRTCFNGVYRLNRSGGFNVPFGRHANPTICDADGLRAAARALDRASVRQAAYTWSLVAPEFRDTAEGHVIYCDPPYVPIKPGSFTRYAGDFTDTDQAELARLAAVWVERGARVVLSNSDTPRVRALYPVDLWDLHPIRVARSVNRTGDRTAADELLIVGKERL